MSHSLIQLSMEPTGVAGFAIRLAFAVTAAMVCALLASALLRRASAALRHRVWALGIVVALLVPAILVALPQRRLGLIAYTTNTIEYSPAARWAGASGANFDVATDVAPMQNVERNRDASERVTSQTWKTVSPPVARSFT